MSNNGQEQRTRPRSFRIDDILATSTETKTVTSSVEASIARNADNDGAPVSRSFPVNVLPLSFGVETLLSPRPAADLPAARYGKTVFEY